MPTGWDVKFRISRKLAVYAAPSAEGGYGQPINDAIRWFNGQKLGVTLVRVQAEKECQISIEAKDGTVTGGSQQDEVKKDIVDATYLREDDRAWIFVPTTPMVWVQLPKPAHGDQQIIRRVAGDPVKTFMIAHELLHCAGLDQDDHTSPKHGDVFTGEGNWVPEAGVSPDHDKMNLSGQVGYQLRQPPLTLHPATRTKLMSVWA